MTTTSMPAYARSALAIATLRVSTAKAGTRNRTLRNEAYGLGRLVGGGVLTEEEVETLLVSSAEACGLGEREARSVIRRALRHGADDPRHPTHTAGGHVPDREVPRTVRRLPPLDQVASLWATGGSVVEDAEVSAGIEGRGLDPDTVELEVLARALPADAPLPPWAWGAGNAWPHSGHRLIIPLYDADGNLASLRARAVVAGVEPKSLAPAGHTTRGAVMADLVGRVMLRGERSEAWNGAVVVVEGEPDFLTWGTNRSEAAEEVPAVLGVESGAWTEAIAARIPTGARVALRTHHDVAGEKYALEIARTLAPRCQVFRSRRSEVS